MEIPNGDAASHPNGDRSGRNLSALASKQTDKTFPVQAGLNAHRGAPPASDWPVIQKERFGAFRRILRAILGRVATPLVCEILRECYNLPRRIRKIYATKIYVSGVLIGIQGSEQRVPLQNALTRDCTRDMQETIPDDFRATMLDRSLFAQAWRLGAKSAMDEILQRDWSKEQLSQAASYLREWGGDIIPPQLISKPRM